MKVKVQLYFCQDDGQKFFGEGPYRLLQKIEELGSLRAAAQSEKMAYSKAFAIIKSAEEQFGFDLTKKKIGGKGGGGSSITEPAKELLQRYQSYKKQCYQMAEELFKKEFSQFCNTDNKGLME